MTTTERPLASLSVEEWASAFAQYEQSQPHLEDGAPLTRIVRMAHTCSGCRGSRRFPRLSPLILNAVAIIASLTRSSASRPRAPAEAGSLNRQPPQDDYRASNLARGWYPAFMINTVASPRLLHHTVNSNQDVRQQSSNVQQNSRDQQLDGDGDHQFCRPTSPTT